MADTNSIHTTVYGRCCHTFWRVRRRRGVAGAAGVAGALLGACCEVARWRRVGAVVVGGVATADDVGVGWAALDAALALAAVWREVVEAGALEGTTKPGLTARNIPMAAAGLNRCALAGAPVRFCDVDTGIWGHIIGGGGIMGNGICCEFACDVGGLKQHTTVPVSAV